MNSLNHKTRFPLERAIEIIEDNLNEADRVFRADLERICHEDAPEASSILDHTIQVMIHNGYIRRFCDGPGMRGYEKTPHWVNRNETLIMLRAPNYKKRIRPRRLVRKDSPAETQASKKMLALGTISNATSQLRGMRRQLNQLELFGP